MKLWATTLLTFLPGTWKGIRKCIQKLSPLNCRSAKFLPSLPGFILLATEGENHVLQRDAAARKWRVVTSLTSAQEKARSMSPASQAAICNCSMGKSKSHGQRYHTTEKVLLIFLFWTQGAHLLVPADEGSPAQNPATPVCACRGAELIPAALQPLWDTPVPVGSHHVPDRNMGAVAVRPLVKLAVRWKCPPESLLHLLFVHSNGKHIEVFPAPFTESTKLEKTFKIVRPRNQPHALCLAHYEASMEMVNGGQARPSALSPPQCATSNQTHARGWPPAPCWAPWICRMEANSIVVLIMTLWRTEGKKNPKQNNKQCMPGLYAAYVLHYHTSVMQCISVLAWNFPHISPFHYCTLRAGSGSSHVFGYCTMWNL